ncbi:MAG: hypothetical protein AAF581_18645 [Planctomycetota bacterium]
MVPLSIPRWLRRSCLLVALVCTALTPLSAQTTVRVSVKHILLTNGVRATGAYTSDTVVQDMIAQANTALTVNNASFRLLLTEITDVANTPYQTMTLSDVYPMEAVAIANAAQYKWRTNAINIYIIPTLSGAGGACSYPTGHEIIVISNNGLLNDGLGWLHEIGHYFSLTHTFSVGNGSCPFSNTCDPNEGAIHAFYTVACPDICPDTNNIMSYNCIFSPTSGVFSQCQLAQMDYELYDPLGSRSHVILPCSQALIDFDCAPDCASSGIVLDWVYGNGNFAYLYRGNSLLTSTSGTSFVDYPGLGTHDYRLVSNGCELTCTTTITATPSQAPNMIWRLGSPSNYDSAVALQTALAAIGETADVSNSRAPFSCATAGQRLWVVAGTRPNAGQLSWQDGQFLRDAILDGVHVYVEGADLWGFDPFTPFHDYDGIDDTTTADGDNGFTAMVGSNQGVANLAGMGAAYNQATPGNDSTDRFEGAAESIGGTAGVIWRKSGSPAYGTGVYYATPPGYGKVICQSWEFGGYGGDQIELARRYVAALGGDGNTRAFEVSGQALGIPYQFGFGGSNPAPHTITGLTHGGSAAAIASAFIGAINSAAASGLEPGISAFVNPFDNTQFVVESTSGDFDFYVSTTAGTPCQVTGNAAGCSFNPMIIEVAPPVIPQFVRGDTNGDGTRNLADAIALLSYLFPNGTPAQIGCLDTADANDLGQINLSDAITILTSLFGSPPVPVAPPLSCGTDPSNDALSCDNYAGCP